MIQTATALHQFWNRFSIPAFAENSVPEEVELPYITYSLTETEPTEPATHYAQVWYRSTGYADLLAKADQIKAAIGTGVWLLCQGGLVVIRPDNPLVQIMADQEPDIRRAYFNLQLNCYHT